MIIIIIFFSKNSRYRIDTFNWNKKMICRIFLCKYWNCLVLFLPIKKNTIQQYDSFKYLCLRFRFLVFELTLKIPKAASIEKSSDWIGPPCILLILILYFMKMFYCFSTHPPLRFHLRFKKILLHFKNGSTATFSSLSRKRIFKKNSSIIPRQSIR